MASPDTTRALPPPVGVHLALGFDVPLQEVIGIDLAPGLDVIPGLVWISSYDPRFLHPIGSVEGTSQTVDLATSLYQDALPAQVSKQSLISHGKFRCMHRRVVSVDAADTINRPSPTPSPPSLSTAASFSCA